jgi:hypothetical protein
MVTCHSQMLLLTLPPCDCGCATANNVLAQEVLDRSITANDWIWRADLETVISDHRQMFGKSLATNINQERLLGDIKFR